MREEKAYSARNRCTPYNSLYDDKKKEKKNAKRIVLDPYSHILTLFHHFNKKRRKGDYDEGTLLHYFSFSFHMQYIQTIHLLSHQSVSVSIKLTHNMKIRKDYMYIRMPKRDKSLVILINTAKKSLSTITQ